MSQTVIKSSVFISDTVRIWEKLQRLTTLQYIAAPYAAFAPEDKCANPVWKSGETYRFRLKLFGVIPLGVHTIQVLTLDRNKFEIITSEGNPFVPVWNHTIELKKIDERRTRYTDEIEIDAGWKTPIVCLWAKMFYAHRQKRWADLL